MRNINTIYKLLNKDKKDTKYVNKLMKNFHKIFIKKIKTYFEWIKTKSSQSLIKINSKILRL